MTRGDDARKVTEEHQRRDVNAGNSGTSASPSDAHSARVPNAEKPQKELKAQRDEPVEQHRSSRRPRQRNVK